MPRHLVHTLLLPSLLAFGACGEPKVTQECSMNGFGRGSCIFTNTGSAAGTVCGHVIVKRVAEVDWGKYTEDKRQQDLNNMRAAIQMVGERESAPFCSGEVASKDSKTVDFAVRGISELCSGPQAWTDNCAFTFVPDGDSEADPQ